MFRRDYLLRMVEEMTDMIGKAFDLKQKKKHIEALWELDEWMKRHFRLNSQLLNSLPTEDIIDLFRIGNGVEVDKVQQVARILEEEGEIYEDQGLTDISLIRYMKALHLYLYSMLNGANRDILQAPERIQQLCVKVKGYELPDKTERLLALYSEEVGRYAEAENSWYRLVEREEHYKEEAREFYLRLLEQDDAKLEQGGLPHHEVEEGLHHLQERFSRS
ncbi:DUF6483 family protein [Paenibacillus sp. Marseille-Q4541]|uniref:DUF6483 family protein n=1 Tax=Paenibacillus sp. Marseille-Q4541 TaxID=2831522 RepID=UPI001BAC83AE|nr:DUF6483 family protein [Paenibacillus sp. Marseille-Q4541]